MNPYAYEYLCEHDERRGCFGRGTRDDGKPGACDLCGRDIAELCGTFRAAVGREAMEAKAKGERRGKGAGRWVTAEVTIRGHHAINASYNPRSGAVVYVAMGPGHPPSTTSPRQALIFARRTKSALAHGEQQTLIET